VSKNRNTKLPDVELPLEINAVVNRRPVFPIDLYIAACCMRRAQNPRGVVEGETNPGIEIAKRNDRKIEERRHVGIDNRRGVRQVCISVSRVRAYRCARGRIRVARGREGGRGRNERKGGRERERERERGRERAGGVAFCKLNFKY